MTTPTDYERLRAICKAATPGPWDIEPRSSFAHKAIADGADAFDLAQIDTDDFLGWELYGPRASMRGDYIGPDAAFIAAANPAAVLALLDAIAALQAERDAAYERAAKVCEALYPARVDGEAVELPCFDTPAECAAAIRALAQQEGTK